MRVDKSDLDDSVVEDGEASTILISDGKSMTARNRDMNGAFKKGLPPVNGVKMPEGSNKPTNQHHPKNGLVATETRRHREPVEDCEEVEGDDRKEKEEEEGGGGGQDVLDSLTHSMKGISIQETSASLGIESKLAQLKVSNKEADEEAEDEDDTRCASFQSQSSVITVDPPSLPHEGEGESGEEEEGEGVNSGAGDRSGTGEGVGGDHTQDLASRGPTAGKPTSFRPNQDGFNRIAGKAYSSHNMDRFHPQPLAAGATPSGFQFAHQGFHQGAPAQFFSSSGMNDIPAPMLGGGGGKRGMDDDEETPFKFTRPVEENGNSGGGGGGGGNDEGNRKGVAYFSQVSADLSCGGNVMVSPEEGLAQSMAPGQGGGRVRYDTQISLSDVDSLLQSFSQYEQGGSTSSMSHSQRDQYDAGYSSEHSPHSEHNAGSPGSSPKSVSSPPMRPPSILSQDSGVASPFSEDTTLSSVLPSPPDHSSIMQQQQQRGMSGWVDSPGGNSTMASYPSPPGSTMYQSPPPPPHPHNLPASSAIMSPPSVGSSGGMSPPSAGMYASQYHSPASVYQSPPGSVYQSPHYQSPPSVPQYHSPPPPASVGSQYHHTAQYSSPASVSSSSSVMSPYNMAANNNSEEFFPLPTTTTIPATTASSCSAAAVKQSPVSPPQQFIPEDTHNDYIFNSRRDELKDALDVIAKDMIMMNCDKKKPTAAVAPTASMAGHAQQQMGQKVASAVAVAASTPTPTPSPAALLTSSPSPFPPPTSIAPPLAPSSLPLSVSQQQKSGGPGRPEKLPIAPLKPAGGARGATPSHQVAAQMMKGAVPVMVVPPGAVPVAPSNIANGSSAPISTTTPAVTTAPVLLMNSTGQNPMILVFNGNGQQPAGLTPQKKKPQKILPRPGPAIPDSANPTSKTPGSKSACSGKGVGGGDPCATITKQEPGVDVACGGLAAGTNGVRTIAPGCQGGSCDPPAPNKKKMASGTTPSQSKMLTIARRLVASMTTTDLQFQDSEGDTYLHVSVCKADKNMVQALLERMSRENLQTMINTQNQMRQTPLYLAVSANSPEMVSLLIQYGADTNVVAEHTRADGKTMEVKGALHCAASQGQNYLPTLQALLTARDLNLELVNSDGHTALHCAILEHGKPCGEGGIVNNLPTIRTLIERGADPNAQGKKNGKTPLMYALELRDLMLIEHLVSLVEPAQLRSFLRTQAYDGNTCQRVMDNLQRILDDAGRQRLHACFRIATTRTSNNSSVSS